MTTDKKKKVYGMILGMAGLALVVDQLIPVDGSDSSNRVEASTAGAVETQVVQSLTNDKTIAIEDTFAKKLETLVSKRELDRSHLSGAFSIPDSWDVVRKVAPKAVVQDKNVVEVDIVKAFEQKHTLTGVFTQQELGVAIINGNKLVRVGMEFEGFQLVEVTESAATFVRQKKIAKLKLKEINAKIGTNAQ